MNSQSNISQDSLSHTQLSPELEDENQELAPESDLWEPPFERWQRLADDLLRDWPTSRKRTGRI